ncbi:helix-turn-helix domain-containing protein [Chitinophaga sp. Hz27]|uniref:helix-turn-helix domain-containing protein n=1 Tax=Chitinophaga sp. Hz27 TaxID=3347169 RepID=UPI0035DD90E8
MAHTHLPSSILQPYIDYYQELQFDCHAIRVVLPASAATMVFKFQGDARYPQQQNDYPQSFAGITGLRKTPRIIHYSQQSRFLVVVFKPAGAAAFFQQPMHLLSDKSIPLDLLLAKQDLADTKTTLAQATNIQQRIFAIESFLHRMLLKKPADSLIEAAIIEIQSACGICKIQELARKYPLSLDAFEKRFKRIVGVTPKQFAFIARMQAIASQQNYNGSLTALAYEFGYYDQSHFHRDFKTFTGQIPKAYFKTMIVNR